MFLFLLKLWIQNLKKKLKKDLHVPSSTIWPQASFPKFSSYSLPNFSSSSDIYSALSCSGQLHIPQKLVMLSHASRVQTAMSDIKTIPLLGYFYEANFISS